MQLTVNGEIRAFQGVADVAALVIALGLDTKKVAVELNLEIVPRSAYGRTATGSRSCISLEAADHGWVCPDG